MNTPRFLVAKYVPDIRRMEPRNFGVIAWNDGVVQHQFVEDVTVGLRKLHVADMHAYRQWIKHWQIQCAKPWLRLKSGELAPRTEPTFLDALRSTATENFLLFDGGTINEHVPQDQTSDLIAELFAELVAEEPSEDEARTVTESDSLRREATKVLRRSGIADRTGFRTGYHWPCPVGNTTQPFAFDYAIYTDKPVALIQKVALLNHGMVYKTAFQFEKMQAAKLVDRDNCEALVYFDEEGRHKSHAMESYKLLQSDGKVINVADTENAELQLRALGLAI